MAPWELAPSTNFQIISLGSCGSYRTLVYIAGYSDFRAQTLSDKIPVIERRFPNYTIWITSAGTCEVHEPVWPKCGPRPDRRRQIGEKLESCAAFPSQSLFLSRRLSKWRRGGSFSGPRSRRCCRAHPPV